MKHIEGLDEFLNEATKWDTAVIELNAFIEEINIDKSYTYKELNKLLVKYKSLLGAYKIIYYFLFIEIKANRFKFKIKESDINTTIDMIIDYIIDSRKTRSKDWREDNAEYFKKYKQDYYIKNKDRIKEKTSKYQIDNKDARNKYKEEWAKNNNDKILAAKRKWRAKNPDKVAAEWERAFKRKKSPVLLEILNFIDTIIDHDYDSFEKELSNYIKFNVNAKLYNRFVASLLQVYLYKDDNKYNIDLGYSKMSKDDIVDEMFDKVWPTKKTLNKK